MLRISPFLLTLFSFCIISCSSSGKLEQSSEKISKPGEYSGYSFAEYKGFTYKSQYLPMKDSTMIAVDVFLPKKLEKGKKIPVIYYPTRYNRSLQAKFPINLIKDPILVIVSEHEIDFFTSHGYACVISDARGTGASSGQRQMEFSPEEINDGKAVLDWIAEQPWCDGKIATSGISYGATMAEMLLMHNHPNLKASVPRSGIFDLYTNIIFPGGVCQAPFVDVWGFTTQSLDKNNYKVFGGQAKLLKGIHTVSGDRNNKILKEAITVHKNNFNIIEGLTHIKYRDELYPGKNFSANDFSVHNQKDKIQQSGAAIYRIGGWYDGALSKFCTEGFLNTSNTKKVLIGPWDHGPANNASPFSATKVVEFNVLAEILRFLDHELKGIDNGIDKEPIINYFNVGEEVWKSTDIWPVAEQQTVPYYLSSGKHLTSDSQQMKEGPENYSVDYTATSGLNSRWNSLTALYKNGPTNYADRRKEDEKLLCFTTEPFSKNVDVTGHPIVHLQFSADADNATVFCYLEDVAPDSSVTYITEGMLNPSYRKIENDAIYKTPYPDHSYREADLLAYNKNEEVELVFDLLPISYRLSAGHRLRVSIAGADMGHFSFPENKPTQFTIYSTHQKPSYIEMPVVAEAVKE